MSAINGVGHNTWLFNNVGIVLLLMLHISYGKLLVTCLIRLRNVQGIAYVFNLSCANFTFSCAILFTSVSSKYEVFTSKQLCIFTTAITTFLCVAASLSRCVVALDRYVYIADPLHYYIRSSDVTVACLILCLWIAAACLTFTPYVTDLFLEGDATDKQCMPIPSNLYELCILLLGVIFPMCYEIFVYTRIFYWAFLHIQIMKQEANYSNQLRQRSVKESYNVDIHQLELFTRASLLMASTMFAMKSDEEAANEQETSDHDPAPSSWSSTLRRVTITSNVASYLSSIVRMGAFRKSNGSDYESGRRNTFVSLGSAIDKAEVQEPTSTGRLLLISSRTETNESMNAEDIFVEEELRRLSRKVEAKGFKVGSKALYAAITKLLTCTELKAGIILFAVLGTLVGCWIPFIIFSLGQHIGLDKDKYVYQRKVANILVYCLSFMDPVIYDILHQPIRNTVKEEIKQGLKYGNRMC